MKHLEKLFQQSHPLSVESLKTKIGSNYCWLKTLYSTVSLNHNFKRKKIQYGSTNADKIYWRHKETDLVPWYIDLNTCSNWFDEEEASSVFIVCTLLTSSISHSVTTHHLAIERHIKSSRNNKSFPVRNGQSSNHLCNV